MKLNFTKINKRITLSKKITISGKDRCFVVAEISANHGGDLNILKKTMMAAKRSGGEANAIAIRMARGSTTRQNVAICGYHGWHDWYLATNLKNNDNLSSHRLPGLEPLGVHQKLKDTAHLFQYNDFKNLKLLVEKKTSE